MDELERLKLLENTHDVCGGSKEEGLGFIYDASTPKGKCPLYKTLMSNACSFDCKYCSQSAKTRTRTASFQPEELAKTFIELQRKHNLHGLFLSSSVVKDPDKTTEKMIETVKLVRNTHGYKGYIHFKVLPGTSYELIKQASEMADRMSINIESPSKSRLNEIATVKDYKIDILRRQAWISKLHDNQTTQFIVGAADETDLELLKMADWEYSSFHLKRIYYSGFKSSKGIELKKKDCSMTRQNRLYNADYLFRKYFIKLKEIKEVMSNEMLPKEDPKFALAKLNYSGAVEINDADYMELLRVPGIGPGSAKRILALQGKIRKYSQLDEMGVVVKRAKPFIKVDGKWQKRLVDFCQ